MKKFHVIALALLLAAALVLIQSFALIKGRTAAAGARSNQKSQASGTIARARVSEEITLRAAGRGGPWINLKDGHDLITDYSGTSGLESVMQQNQARPLALASGDFDEDGVPDLISGYGCANCSTNLSVSDVSGLLTLHRGNVDAIYPNTADADQRKASGEFTETPFLSPGLVFAASAEPDFIGAGDFDADGHLDVVMAARGGDKLYWLAGDGHGGFGRGQGIELPGTVTALTTGEINRADGLADIVVGIAPEVEGAAPENNGPGFRKVTDLPHIGRQSREDDGSADAGSAGGSPAVLVFEGPEGALKQEPEEIALPAPASSLALGQLDDSYEMDLAVAAGSELVIVHGRDRKLSLDAESRAEVASANIEREPLSFAITSLAIGDFSGDYRSEIALLSADGVVRVLDREAKSGEWGRIVGDVATGSNVETMTVGEAGRMSSTPSGLPAWGPRPALPVLVRARVSVSGSDDLLVLNRADHQVQVIANDAPPQAKGGQSLVSASPSLRVAASLDIQGEPMAVLPMRLNSDALSDLVVLKQGGQGALAVAVTAPVATFTVNQTSDQNDANTDDVVCDTDLVTAGLQCTLRAAIMQANASVGADAINFTVSSITAATQFRQISGALTIDGGSGRVEIKGAGWGGVYSSASVTALFEEW